MEHYVAVYRADQRSTIVFDPEFRGSFGRGTVDEYNVLSRLLKCSISKYVMVRVRQVEGEVRNSITVP